MNKYREISKNIREITIDNPRTPEDKLAWLNIIHADEEELEFLKEKFHFNLNHIQASSYKIRAQRPSIEEGKEYFFLVLQFPIATKKGIEAEEINFFIQKGLIATVHNNRLASLKDFFNSCKKDGESFLSYETESSAILLYEMLKKILLGCYLILDDNSLKIDEIEKLIFSGQQKKSVSKIMALRRDIVNMRKIMQSHKNVIKAIMEKESRLVPAHEMKKYYNELIGHTKRIWEIMENQKEMIDVFHDTNESLINNQISAIMKTLTIFSVIVFPLTLFAAIFGMNTVGGMPFVENKNGFWGVIIIMVIGCIGMLTFFKRKRWL